MESSHGSEVANLLAQISTEYTACKEGLTGLAYGRARHDFIERRNENMGEAELKLIDLIGYEQTCTLVDLAMTVVELEQKVKQVQATQEVRH